MATTKKNPTRPGHWKVEFTTGSSITDSPRFGKKADAEAFRDEQLRHTGPYHEQVSAQLYEYMDNGSYRARGKPKKSSASNPRDTEVDEHAANELELYIDNDEPLYRQWQAIVKNLWKFRKKGTYSSSRAADGFMHLVDPAAKKYAKEFDSPKNWNTIFTVPTRRAVAESYAKSFEDNGRDEIEYAPPGALHNPGKSPRKKNPGRSKNGAGLGALIGSTIGAVAGFGAGSVPLAALGSLAGGTVGGYLGAPKDRKKRGAAGGAIGGAVLGPVGAGLGGYVGGTKPDKDYRRHNPEQIHCDMERGCGAPVTHVDSKGYVYCTKHGAQRKASGTSCRRLTSTEVETLRSGGTIRYRNPEQNPGACACSPRTAALSRRLSKI